MEKTIAVLATYGAVILCVLNDVVMMSKNNDFDFDVEAMIFCASFG